MIILIPKQTHNIYSTFVPKVSLSLSRLFYSVCVCVCGTGFLYRTLAMEVMSHSSAFLLPTIPADHRHPQPYYALVVLNQNLPRFTPLLWKHGTYPAPSLSLCSFFLFLIFWEMIRCVRTCYLEQLNFVSVLMEVQTVCMMKCLCSFHKKTPPMFEPGLFLLWYIYFFPLI